MLLWMDMDIQIWVYTDTDTGTEKTVQFIGVKVPRRSVPGLLLLLSGRRGGRRRWLSSVFHLHETQN